MQKNIISLPVVSDSPGTLLVKGGGIFVEGNRATQTDST